jgi:hypothetical protein
MVVKKFAVRGALILGLCSFASPFALDKRVVGSQIIPNITCNSQENMLEPGCPAKPGRTCNATYDKANMAMGMKTQLVNVNGGGEGCETKASDENCVANQTPEDTFVEPQGCSPTYM